MHWLWLDESTADLVLVGHWFCTLPEHQLLTGHALHVGPLWKNAELHVQGQAGVMVQVPEYDALGVKLAQARHTLFVAFVHVVAS